MRRLPSISRSFNVLTSRLLQCDTQSLYISPRVEVYRPPTSPTSSLSRPPALRLSSSPLHLFFRQASSIRHLSRTGSRRRSDG